MRGKRISWFLERALAEVGKSHGQQLCYRSKFQVEKAKGLCFDLALVSARVRERRPRLSVSAKKYRSREVARGAH